MREKKIYYQEYQRQRAWWVWLIMVSLNLLFIYACVSQIIFDRPFGNNPMSDKGLIIVTILTLGFSVWYLLDGLHTYIDKTGIYIRYAPFHLKSKFYDWNNIDKCYIRKFNPFTETGGVGIKIRTISFRKTFPKFSYSYTVAGNIGLEVVLSSGKRVLIGTQNPTELERVLEKLGKKNG